MCDNQAALMAARLRGHAGRCITLWTYELPYNGPMDLFTPGRAKRTEFTILRLTKVEDAVLRAAAEERGVSVSAYVRSLIRSGIEKESRSGA